KPPRFFERAPVVSVHDFYGIFRHTEESQDCALYFMVLGSGNAVVSQLFCGRRVLGFGDEDAGRPSLVIKLCRFASAPRLAATQDFHGVCLMERVGNYQKGRHPGQDRLSKEIRSSPCRQEKQNRNEQNVPVFLRHRFLRLSINRTGEYKSFKCLKRSASRKHRFGVQLQAARTQCRPKPELRTKRPRTHLSQAWSSAFRLHGLSAGQSASDCTACRERGCAKPRSSDIFRRMGFSADSDVLPERAIDNSRALPMVRVLVSSCLLGESVRNDGSHARADNTILERWKVERRLVPFCPELAGGFSV